MPKLLVLMSPFCVFAAQSIARSLSGRQEGMPTLPHRVRGPRCRRASALLLHYDDDRALRWLGTVGYEKEDSKAGGRGCAELCSPAGLFALWVGVDGFLAAGASREV